MDDTRISLRITDVELDEMDDFLARHPEYQNRSQLLRTAVMEFMKMVDRGEYKNTGVRVEMQDRLLMILEDYVDYRYFSSVEEIINYVMKTIVREGILEKILKGYVTSLNGLRLGEEERMREERLRMK